jgi:sugar phosphate isomerase/epimerase
LNDSLHDYIKVGLVHFMAWPECMGGDGPHLESIATIANDPFFEVIEITRINDTDTRARVREMLSTAGMDVCFGAQPILLGGDLDLNHAVDEDRQRAVDAVKAGIDEAQEMGIENIGLLSGRPDADTPAAIVRLVASLKELCGYAASRGCNVVLETFDQVPFGKNCLIGPTHDAVEVSQAVRAEYPDFGLLLDLSHLPLIGETSEEAIGLASEHLVHVHIGNCAMDDPDHPAYGDNHPRFGAPGTRNDVPELTEFLAVLLDTGYLTRDVRKAISFEVKPMPGETAEFIIEHSKNALQEAWEQL